MNATKTGRNAMSSAEEWASQLIDELPDLETVKAVAAEAAHRAGEWVGEASGTAADWIGGASQQALTLVPALAAKQARRRRMWGWSLALVPLAYFFDPKRGSERRAKVKAWFKKDQPSAGTTTPSFSTQSANSTAEKQSVGS